MREQTMLEEDMPAIWEYAGEHPSSYAGLSFINSMPGDREPVALKVHFTARLDEHLTALRARVSHPDRVVVALADHSQAEVAAARPVIEGDVRSWVRGRIPGFMIGNAIGRVHVSLHALGTDGEDAARQFVATLRERHDDLVDAEIDYPRQLGAETGKDA